MDKIDEKYMLVFASNNQAMMLYDRLLKRGCTVELISTPCRIVKSCSQSIVFRSVYAKIVIEEIKNRKIQIKHVYKIIENNGKKDYVPIKKS